jgi:hypothetical protein
MSAGIELATVCTDGYLPGALVCLHSLNENFKDFGALPLTVYCAPGFAPLSEESRHAIRAVAPQTRFEEVERDAYRNATCPTPDHRAAFLTLEVFRNADTERVLFFDADLLCIADPSAILNIDADFVACRAEAEYSPEEGPRAWCPVNTGFFTIGHRWRTEMVFESLLDGIATRHDTNFADQSVINARFTGETVHLMPDIYNFRHWGGRNRAGRPTGSDALFQRMHREIRMIHYSGYLNRPKPWSDMADRSYGAIAEWHEWARRCVRAHPAVAGHFSEIQ